MRRELVVTRTELLDDQRVLIEAHGALNRLGQVDSFELTIPLDEVPLVGTTLEVTITEVAE